MQISKLHFITVLTALAPAVANAQAVKFESPSVTIYELGPANFTSASRAVTAPTIAPAYAAPTIPEPSQAAIENYAAGNIQIKPTSVAETTSEASEPPPPLDTGLLGAKWNGRANIGASLQTGNTEQDAINGDAEIKARWRTAAGDPKHRASIKAEINRETEDDNKTEDNRFIQGAYDYFFNKKLFLNSTLGFEQDDIENLDLRTTAGLGLGHQIYERDDLNLQYVFGPSYLHEEFDNGDTDDALTVRWALDYNQKIWFNTLEAYHDHELFVPTDDTEGFLIDTRTGLRIPLREGLVVSGEVQFDWDDDPVEGTVEDDTTYAVKVGYEW